MKAFIHWVYHAIGFSNSLTPLSISPLFPSHSHLPFTHLYQPFTPNSTPSILNNSASPIVIWHPFQRHYDHQAAPSYLLPGCYPNSGGCRLSTQQCAPSSQQPVGTVECTKSWFVPEIRGFRSWNSELHLLECQFHGYPDCDRSCRNTL